MELGDADEEVAGRSGFSSGFCAASARIYEDPRVPRVFVNVAGPSRDLKRKNGHAKDQRANGPQLCVKKAGPVLDIPV